MRSILYFILFIVTIGNAFGQNQDVILGAPFLMELKSQGIKKEYDSNGFTLLSKDSKFGIAQNDKIIIPCEYDSFLSIFETSKRVSAVIQNSEFFLLDLKGKKVGNSYDYLSYSYPNETFIAKKENKYLLINASGKEISKKYDFIEYDQKSFFKVKLGSYYGVIDSNDIIMIPFEYDTLPININAIFYKVKKTKYGVIDSSNKIIIPFLYDNISYSNEGKGILANVFIFTSNDKEGIIDLKNKVLIQPNYDKIVFTNDYLKVSQNNKYGVINQSEQLIIPFEYSGLYQFEGKERFRVSKDKLWGVIDSKNNLIIPFKYKKIAKGTFEKNNANNKTETIYKVSLDGENYISINEKNEVAKE